jgi:hypothetical protein
MLHLLLSICTDCPANVSGDMLSPTSGSQSSTLKMEAACSSKTMAALPISTQYRISVEFNIDRMHTSENYVSKWITRVYNYECMVPGSIICKSRSTERKTGVVIPS